MNEYLDKFRYLLKTKGPTETLKRALKFVIKYKLPRRKKVENKKLMDTYKALMQKHARGQIKGIAIITSAFEFDELYNQRTINLAKFLSKEGFGVIYVAWQWTKNDELQKNYQCFLNNIYQVPLYDFITSDFESFNLVKNKKFFITFPTEMFYDLIAPLREKGFQITYDIMDEWEEFYLTGDAPWYKKEIEEGTVLNADAIFCVSEPLKAKFEFLRDDIEVNGNGYSEALSKNRNISLQKSSSDQLIHVGYFGHMTESWFDWDLVFDLAENSNTYIHLIGYGASEAIISKLNSYSNIKYYGKVHPSELHTYVSKWHIGIIPFKESNLSKAVDPIKIYEYLFFGLPTISTGIPHLNNYPLVTHCNNSSEVYNELVSIYEDIIHNRLDKKNIEDFLLETTWDNRFKTMLQIMNKIDSMYS